MIQQGQAEFVNTYSLPSRETEQIFLTSGALAITPKGHKIRTLVCIFKETEKVLLSMSQLCFNAWKNTETRSQAKYL